MAEKILNTRLMLKYDSYANWTSNNPVLKKGEMAVATVANTEANQATGFTNLPNIVLKVGDGTSHYNDLKFVSALAADVHSWAKAADKPVYGWNEITDFDKRVLEVETNTQYNLVATDANNYKYELRSKGKTDVEWTKVADLDLSGIVGRVAALEAKFTGMEEATVVAHVQKKIEGLDMAKATITQGEIFESIEENDGVVAVTKRKLVAADIPELAQSKITGLEKALEDLEKKVGDDAGSAEQNAKEYINEKIEALDYLGGEFGAHKFATKVTQADGAIEAVYAQPEISDITGLETRLSGIEGNVTNLGNNKQDKLGFEGEYNKETNKVVTKAHLTSVIEGLDYTGGGFGEHKFATKIVEADGVVAATYAQPEIGDIKDLTSRLTGIDGEIAKKQDILGIVEGYNKETNKVATVDYVTNAVADLNGAMHFKGVVESLPTIDGENYKAGDVVLMGYDEYVCDGSKWIMLGNESIYQTKELAKEQHEAMTKTVSDLADRHDSELAALTKKHNDEIAALDAAYKKAITDLDAAEVKAGQGEIIDSVKEADGVVAVTKRALVKEDIPTIEQAQVNGLPKALTDLGTAITEGDAATLAAAKKYSDDQLKSKVEGLDYTDAPVAKQFVTSVSEADGVIAVTRAPLAAEDIPVIEQAQVNGLAKALENAAKAGTDAAAQALADAKTYTNGKIESLDYNDTEVAKNVVTAVSQADGVIAVTRKPLADIAWSGEVKDLKQTDTVIVFNCGNSFVDTANEFVM